MSAIKQDGPYDSRTLTKVFCGSSVLLAISTVWMVLDDHTRVWKRYQEDFRTIEVQRAVADVHEAERALSSAEGAAKLKAIEDELAAANEAIKKHDSEISDIQGKIEAAQALVEKANLAYAMAKADVDSFVYFYEHSRMLGEASHVVEYGEKLAHANHVLYERAHEKEKATLDLKALRDRLAAIEAPRTTALKKREELEANHDRAKRKLEAIGPGFLNDHFRNKPVFDFIDRTLRERQIVLPNLRDDLYFAQVRKVDRCVSCHLAADRKGFEGSIVHIEGKGLVSVDKVEAAPGGGHALRLPNGHVDVVTDQQLKEEIPIKAPFRSHPNLDLYLSSSSPHPIDKFGCTVCHLGEGESITFTTATHAPNDETQRAEWHKNHHWEEREHWTMPQFPTRYVEASCILCHANNRPVPGADKLNFGRETWERLSCVGCHKMKGYEDEPKRGPDLRRMTAKLGKDWVAYWIDDPVRFRPKTNMPRFFHHKTPTDEEKKEARTPDPNDPKKVLYDYDVREKVEVRAITEFLFDRSAAFVKEEEARGEGFKLGEFQKGDSARGRILFTARGCVGCHRIETTEAEAKAVRTYAPDEFGPNLYNLAHKTTPQWVQAWISNPKHYWAESRMPNLRLTADEARDLTTYLIDGIEVEGRNEVKDAALPGFQPLAPLNQAEDGQLASACRDYLEKDYTTPEIDAIFEDRSAELPKLKTQQAKLRWLGEQSVSRYGCFGCHFVKGMESRPGIGRELSDIGDKNLLQVDWGFESVSRFAEEKPANKIRENRHEWLHLKIEEPRIFDAGKVKLPLDRSRMPKFSTTKFEREALVTYLLGHTGIRRVPDEYRYKPQVRRANVIEGEYALQRNNCKACHLMAADKVALADAEKKPIQRALTDKLGAPIKSTISDKPVNERAWLDAHILLDNMALYGEKDGAAIIQVYADGVGPFADKKAGFNVAAAPEQPQSRVDVVKSPIVGMDADLLAVAQKMPADVWSSEAEKKAQLDAIQRGLGNRNRGGTALEKIMRARAVEKVGYDPFSLAGKDKFDNTDLGAWLKELPEAKTFAPPHLINEGQKVQPLWLQSFLKDPVEIRPALRPFDEWTNRSATSFEKAGGPKMPTYGFRDGETQTFSRYFAAVDEEERLAKVKPLLEEIQRKVKAKEEGFRSRLDITLKVQETLDALAVREYFTTTIVDGVFNYAPRGDVSLSRALEEKSDTYVASREARVSGPQKLGGPGWYSAAWQMFLHPDIDCRKCHFLNGAAPAGTVDAFAPDLARVRERLRPDYLQEWIENPAAVIPGTKMPVLFLPGQKQEILPGSQKVQVASMVDWLMAGATPVMDVFPKPARAGSEVRISSPFVNLDSPKLAVEVKGPDGAVTRFTEGGNPGFVRERSGPRTTAIRLEITGAAKGKTYVVTVKDDRFTASSDLPVAE